MKRMRKSQHSPEEKVRLQAIRDQFQRTIRSKAKLLLHGMKSLCYGDPAAFNSEALGNQED